MFTILVIGSSQFYTQSFDKTTVLIGRALDSDIVLPDLTVSRRQARIHVEQQDFSIEDLKSANGCYVNRVLVSGVAAVLPHDELRIGTYALFLQHGHGNIGSHLGRRASMSGDYSEDRTAQFLSPAAIGANSATTRPHRIHRQIDDTRIPTRASLRKLMSRVLVSDADFEAFLLDYFSSIRARCSASMERVSKMNLLLEHVPADEILRFLRADYPTATTSYQELLSYESV